MKCRIYIASSLPMYSFHPLYTTYTCSVARSQAWQEILSRMSPQLRRDTYREVNVHWVKKARRGLDGAFGWGWDMDGLRVEDIFRTEFSRKALACFFQWTWNQDWNERWQGFGLSFNCTPQQMLSFGNEGMREWGNERMRKKCTIRLVLILKTLRVACTPLVILMKGSQYLILQFGYGYNRYNHGNNCHKLECNHI